ncbi:MAG TPA: hypothetical protein VF158_09510 [Longimicrobiales bacterium]
MIQVLVKMMVAVEALAAAVVTHVSGTRAKPGIGTTLIPVRFTKLLVRGATAVGDRLRENFHPIRTCVVITVLIW